MNFAHPSRDRVDIDIHGSGLVARAMALALAQAGFKVGASIAPDSVQRGADLRAFAITPASKRLLQGLGVWPAAGDHRTSPILAMSIRDGMSRLRFSAAEQGVAELACMLEPAALESAMLEALTSHERVVWRGPHLKWADLPATLDIICEGAASNLVSTAGVETEIRDYGQRAISVRLGLNQAHEQVARQWFAHGEVLALLPLGASQPGNEVSVVWSVSADRATQLLGMEANDWLDQLKLVLDTDAAAVGEMRLCGERGSWPLAAALAAQFSGTHAGRAWVLAGDAAHRVHPLAGLGLNLGLGDVDTFVQVLLQTRDAQHWRAISDPKLLREYARKRQAKAQATLAATDGLFQLVRARNSPGAAGLAALRRFGMSAVQQVAPLKRWLATQAMR